MHTSPTPSQKPHSLQPYWPVSARIMKFTWRQPCTPFKSTPCLPARLSTPMFLKHGQTTGPDLQKLRDSLLKLLPALAELETHMDLFMLALVKLTASGHGKNPYRYFEMFLESVKGFPVLRQQLPGFFTAYPTVNQENNNGTFCVSPPSHHTHDGKIQRFSVFRGSNCSAQAYPESSPEVAQKNSKVASPTGTPGQALGSRRFHPISLGRCTKSKHRLLSLTRIARRRMWRKFSDAMRSWRPLQPLNTFLLLRKTRGTKMALQFFSRPRRFYYSPQCRVVMADEERYQA
jgi:hypothetical protein